MTEDQFLSKHTNTWYELESYCKLIDSKGIKGLSTSDIRRFLSLFKLTSHHLAYAKTHYTGSQTIHYLNSIVTKCNAYVYTTPKPNLLTYFSSLLEGYNKLLRKYKAFILFSFGMFLLGSLISFILVMHSPELAKLFTEPDIVDSISENGTSGSAGDWNYPLMSSYIMVNNISVSIKAFVFGITLGLGTAYILFINGLTLGSLTALFYLYGDPAYYWSLILPHGVTELTAIFISGAAGFIIAESFLLPGKLSRKDSVISGTHHAIELMGGVVFLLVIAGLIEGFFTPLPISVIAKLLFALLTAILLCLYFVKAYFDKV